MRRGIFHVACGLSLMLCVAAIALGCAGDRFIWEWPAQPFIVVNDSRSIAAVGGWDGGYVGLFRQRRVHQKPPLVRKLWPAGLETMGIQAEEVLGDEGYINGKFDGVVYTRCLLMVRAAVALSAILPALWITVFLRRKRPSSGLCAVCSYDLTGNASGICPECGTKLKREVAANI